LTSSEDKFAETCDVELKKVTDYVTLKLSFKHEDNFAKIDDKIEIVHALTQDELESLQNLIISQEIVQNLFKPTVEVEN
jgi:hypothetical protein